MTEFERVRRIEEALAKAFASKIDFMVEMDGGERFLHHADCPISYQVWGDRPVTSLYELARDMERCLTADGVLA